MHHGGVHTQVHTRLVRFDTCLAVSRCFTSALRLLNRFALAQALPFRADARQPREPRFRAVLRETQAVVVNPATSIQQAGVRPIREPRIWISEGSTQADSSFQGVEFPGPQGASQKFRANGS